MVAALFRSCLPESTTVYHDVKHPPDLVKRIFEEAAHGKEYMNASDITEFLQKVQGEESITSEQAEALITKSKSGSSHHFFHHKHAGHNEADGVYLTGFVKLLLNSDLNAALKPKEKTHDMTAPLAHYYLYTSHNSYLTGNQLTSRSSTTPIIEALKNGCRVIELDCWEKRGKIKVLHGRTLTAAVKFEDCVKAIRDYAFVASDYPVIITVENHLRWELQIEAAKIFKEILGEAMFIPNAEERPPLEFLSPESLKGRIIISDKPFHELVELQVERDPDAAVEVAEEVIGIGNESPPLDPKRKDGRARHFIDRNMVGRGAKAYDEATPAPDVPKAEEFEELLYIHCEKPSEMKEKHVKGGPLVSGDRAIMANLSEPQLSKIIKTHPASVIEYTKMNLGRLYPFGLRFDSSNADPMSAWSHGVQLAAMNLQGRDRPVWLCQGFFLANGNCGYVRKPQVLLPECALTYEEILNLPPKLSLKVRILLGTDWHKHFDFFKKPDIYVKVAVHGITTDNLKQKTKVAVSSKEPKWEDEEFEFPIRVPELAVLRFEVWEQDRFDVDDFVGQACYPVTELRSGIRVVALRSRKGSVRSSKLLCQIKMDEINLPPQTDSV